MSNVQTKYKLPVLSHDHATESSCESTSIITLVSAISIIEMISEKHKMMTQYLHAIHLFTTNNFTKRNQTVKRKKSLGICYRKRKRTHGPHTSIEFKIQDVSRSI